MHGGSGELTPSMQNGLAVFYLLGVLLNVGFATYQYFARRDPRQSAVWSAVAGLFLAHVLLYLLHVGPVLPLSFRANVTWLMGQYGGQMGPILYISLSVIGFLLLIRYRK